MKKAYPALALACALAGYLSYSHRAALVQLLPEHAQHALAFLSPIKAAASANETQEPAPPRIQNSTTKSKSLARPVSASIRRVLPKLTQTPTDWRKFRPEKITFSPYPDTPMEFTATSIREENGRTIWTGRNSLDGAFLVAVGSENHWSAELALPGANIFTTDITGETATLSEIHDTTGTCALCARPHIASSLTPTTTGADPTASSVTSAAEGDLNTVDLIVFYHPQLINPTGTNSSTYRTREQIENQLNLHLTYMNQALANSQVTNLQWRYIALYETPDTPINFDSDLDQGTALGQNLNSMANSNTTLGAFVREKTLFHGADQALLYLPFATNRTSPFTAGIAFQPGRNAVVSLTSGASATTSHELAHNVGCAHDRTEAAVADSNGLYNYGHIDATGNFRTIMSYGSRPRIPYFSNPDVIYNARPTGLPSTDPKAADNARRIREQAVTFAAFRTAAGVAPVITAQPASLTVNTSANFTLSVTATGDSLAYQWRKDSANLSGATASTYTKTATTTDAGSYTVIVTNPGGNVTSSAATVSVTAAPPTPVPPPTPTPTPNTGDNTGGGGGGGGGSPSLIYLSALALLAARRLTKFNSKG